MTDSVSQSLSHRTDDLMTDDEKDPIPMSSLTDDEFSYATQRCDGDSKQSNSGHLSSLQTSS